MSIQGATAHLPPERPVKASDTRGAYGGVAAHEATKRRSREAQRKLRKRHKVRHHAQLLWETHGEEHIMITSSP